MQIGEMLIKAGVITQQQLESALDYQKSIGGHLAQIIVKLGHAEESAILSFLSQQMQIRLFDLSGLQPDPGLMGLLPQEVIERLNIIPLKKEMGILTVGVSDPTDFSGIDEIRIHVGGGVETVLVSASQARDIINHFFAVPNGTEKGGNKRPVRRGRNNLAELVHELERDVRLQELAEKGGGDLINEFGAIPEKRLLLALVMALEEKGVLTRGEILSAVAKLQVVENRLEELRERGRE
jgi:type IV pilus assembly protein PilB